MSEHREIEAKFLEVDVAGLTQRLHGLGAHDLGEDMFEEVIIYDADLTWPEQERMVRIRKMRDQVVVSYKHHQKRELSGTEEIEFVASDYEKAKQVFAAIGMRVFREQEKKRHSYELTGTKVEFDTWPGIPTYVEIEGEDEEAVRSVSKQLGLDWSRAVFKSAGKVIEEDYGIPVMGYRYFTFTKTG